MARETFISKGIPFVADSSSNLGFSLTKFVRGLLKRFNVPFYDKCCPEASIISPVSVIANTLATYNLSTSSWQPLRIVGAVTQATSKTTAVTSNAHFGTITTVALTDAADTSFSFTLTNNKIDLNSIITATAINAGNGIAVIQIVSVAAGSAVIKVTNAGTVAFNSLIKINFTIS